MGELDDAKMVIVEEEFAKVHNVSKEQTGEK